LIDKYAQAGGELRYRASVGKILTEGQKVTGVKLDSGEELRAGQVFSSMGLPETIMRTDESLFKTKSRIGKMTFLESIFVFDKKPLTASDATIYFYNNAPTYAYRPAQNYFDATSA